MAVDAVFYIVFGRIGKSDVTYLTHITDLTYMHAPFNSANG